MTYSEDLKNLPFVEDFLIEKIVKYVMNSDPFNFNLKNREFFSLKNFYFLGMPLKNPHTKFFHGM